MLLKIKDAEGPKHSRSMYIFLFKRNNGQGKHICEVIFINQIIFQCNWEDFSLQRLCNKALLIDIII